MTAWKPPGAGAAATGQPILDQAFKDQAFRDQALRDQALDGSRRERHDRTAFCLCVSLLLVFSQGWVSFLMGSDADPEASGLIRDVYFPWYAVAGGLLLARPGRSLGAMVRTPLIWLLITVAACSTAWSIDPGVTERRVIAVLFTTLAGVAIGSRYDWPDLAEVLATAFAGLAGVSFLLGLAWPSHGRMPDIFPGAWRGLYFDKNGLGDAMALGFMVFLAAAALRRERRRLWLGFAGLALLLVLLSTSKTSLVSLMIGAAAFGAVGLARRGPVMAVVVTFGAVVAIAAIASLILFDADAVLGLLGKDATLTGRTKIWSVVLEQIHTRPWTGFGYGAVWTDDSGWGPLAWIVKEAGFRPHHAHTRWLEPWSGLGYVGLAVWGALFLQTLAMAVLAVYRNAGAYLALPILTVYGLLTLTESVVFVYNEFDWVIFTVLAVRLAMPGVPREALREVRLASAAP